jgi:ABC-type dipeptide/oligopeptide/nickel transport system permease component
VHGGFLRFILRRAAFAALLVLVVSSVALALARVAPGSGAIGMDPAAIAAERHRLGLDRPFLSQYAAWLSRSARLDFGESLIYRQPVLPLLRERATRTALLGCAALILATLTGIPLGVFTGSRPRGALPAVVRGASVVLLSVPSLITSLLLLLIAARTGWLPTGGYGVVPPDAGLFDAAVIRLRHVILPAIAIALPLAASLERLQSGAMRDALAEPCMLAALARGVPRRRLVWRSALRLSLAPVLAVYGIVIGSVLGGSFVVEIVTSWQGLGDLMYRALAGRDIYLVAGCAAAGSLFLAAGILVSDVALAAVDPRVEGQT